MRARVERLRTRSLEARPSVSAERALLMTEFYRENEGRHSTPVLRALAFAHLCRNKTIHIGQDELIVGERGPAPAAVPTYPEITCHSLEDLRILDSREKTSYKVAPDVVEAYRETIIPFWTGRTLRELAFSRLQPEWHDAYEGGIFTEFLEQRAPGHTVADERIYRIGLLDLKRRIGERLEDLLAASQDRPAASQDRPATSSGTSAAGDAPRRGGRSGKGADSEPHRFDSVEDQIEQLKAMEIAADGAILFARRHAELVRSMAEEEVRPARRAELLRIAEVCRRVPAHAPRSFHEALQAYWFHHLGVITELNGWDSFNPGHLDQHLEPFYKQGLEDGSLTREDAKELLECFWVKFSNHPAPPKVGVTAAESGTYTDFANINLGGLRRDGTSAVNEVSYLLLEVIDEMHILQPSNNIQLSRENPEEFVKAAARIIRKGYGFPSVFNADAVVQEMVRQGKSLEDAREGGTSGCVETGAFGKEAYILTGYFNLVKILELALNDGFDPRTGRHLGPRTGDPAGFESLDRLFEAWRMQLRHFIEIKVRGNEIFDRLYMERIPAPFLSLIIDDCIEKGLDYNRGGARYNTSYIQGVGTGTLTDSLAAIKHLVFDEKTIGMRDLLDALRADFQETKNAGSGSFEVIRQLVLNRAPKYGNDDDRADDLMRRAFDAFFESVEGRPTSRGGTYQIDMLPTTCHVYFGSVTGATPDGRRAGRPLSEGISPVQGADRKGPTAVLRSAGKMDHLRTGGTLLNMKFTPQVLEDERGIDALAGLIRGYFRMNGHHVQFNVIGAETLRRAQADPEEHRNLIVRVAGYSDYFCDLSRELQDEIISRTEH